MPINARTKGHNGEREIAIELNAMIGSTMKSMGLPEDVVRKGYVQVQRNQNQSAVGGKDLVGTFDLAIEVKRAETLLIPAWWAQACASCESWETPVLLYRQNREAWKAMLPGLVQIDSDETLQIPVTITWTHFQEWFRKYIRSQLSSKAT